LSLTAFLAGGCASSTNGAADAAPPSLALSADNEALLDFIRIQDPIERTNRSVYAFNAVFDDYVFLPIVDTYTAAVPEVLRDRVRDFFSNLGELVTFANLVLQLRPGPAAETVFRFGTNTILGFGGLIDLASAFGMRKYEEDFGQTLGYWGVGEGPYLVLPVFGPSNVRDAVGLATDRVGFALVDPFGISSFQSEHPESIAVDAVDTRANVPFRYFGTGSPFEYDYVRLLYTKKRRVDVDR
jgi:phospholipid-binding lipoprotein MlaA